MNALPLWVRGVGGVGCGRVVEVLGAELVLLAGKLLLFLGELSFLCLT